MRLPLFTLILCSSFFILSVHTYGEPGSFELGIWRKQEGKGGVSQHFPECNPHHCWCGSVKLTCSDKVPLGERIREIRSLVKEPVRYGPHPKFHLESDVVASYYLEKSKDRNCIYVGGEPDFLVRMKSALRELGAGEEAGNDHSESSVRGQAKPSNFSWFGR